MGLAKKMGPAEGRAIVESDVRGAVAKIRTLAKEKKKLSGKRLAAAAGISETNLYNWSDGTNTPTLEKLQDLAVAAGAVVRVVAHDGSRTIDEEGTDSVALSEIALEVAQLVDRLPPDVQREARAYINGLRAGHAANPHEPSAEAIESSPAARPR